MLQPRTPLDSLLDGVNLSALERLGVVSRACVSRWRRGASWPQYAAVRRLAFALGRDMGEVTDAVASTIAAARARNATATPRSEEPRT